MLRSTSRPFVKDLMDQQHAGYRQLNVPKVYAIKQWIGHIIKTGAVYKHAAGGKIQALSNIIFTYYILFTEQSTQPKYLALLLFDKHSQLTSTQPCPFLHLIINIILGVKQAY